MESQEQQLQQQIIDKNTNYFKSLIQNQKPIQCFKHQDDIVKYICIDQLCKQYLNAGCSECLLDDHKHCTTKFLRLKQFQTNLVKNQTNILSDPNLNLDQLKQENLNPIYDKELSQKFLSISKEWKILADYFENKSQQVMEEGKQQAQTYPSNYNNNQSLILIKKMMETQDSRQLQDYIKELKKIITIDLKNNDVQFYVNKDNSHQKYQNKEQLETAIKDYYEYTQKNINYFKHKAEKLDDFMAMALLGEVVFLPSQNAESRGIEVEPNSTFTFNPSGENSSMNQQTRKRRLLSRNLYNHGVISYKIRLLHNPQDSRCGVSVGVMEERDEVSNIAPWDSSRLPFQCLHGCGCVKHMEQSQGFNSQYNENGPQYEFMITMDFNNNAFIVNVWTMIQKIDL